MNKKEEKVKISQYEQSKRIHCQLADVKVVVLSLTTDTSRFPDVFQKKEVKIVVVTTANGKTHFLFSSLIKPFTNNSNFQRTLYKFKSPSEKFSLGGKMYLTKDGLILFLDQITLQMYRSNGMFNKPYAKSFVDECKKLFF